MKCRVRVTVTADQLAMMVSNDEQRKAWIERYEGEIEAIKRNSLRDAKERYEKNMKAGSIHDTEWAKGMIKSLERTIAHKYNMIDKLMAMQF